MRLKNTFQKQGLNTTELLPKTMDPIHLPELEATVKPIKM